MVTTLFMWLVGNQVNKVFVYPVHINPVYILLFLYPLNCALYQKQQDLLEFWEFWSVFASGLPLSFPSVDALRKEGCAQLSVESSCHYCFLQGYCHVLCPHILSPKLG